jgi:ABC-2 type transport system ATP-binding protein
VAPVIEVSQLEKHFRVAKHYRGMLGPVRNFLSREYTLVRAVDSVSFSIAPGELVGYLGPNGAGKSTTIKMLTGLLVPTGGSIVVQGRVPWRERRAHVAQIGAVFGQRTTLWWDLPVVESLDLLKYVYHIPTDRFETNMSEFLELLELGEFLDTPTRSLSLGQRMRADLCAALLHDPPLLFLDEPTIGLDVVAKDRIRRFINHVNSEHGTTVILTTHDLSDVEKLCERVMIIDHGKLLYDGALDVLRDRFGGRRELVVDFDEHYAAPEIVGADILARDERRVTYAFDRGDVAASDLIGQLSEHYRIRDLQVREPDIEETIRRIYEERLLE